MDGAEQGSSLPRLGVVATDELLITGLRTLLESPPGWEIVVLAEPGTLVATILELVLIDVGATDHVLELVTSFRRLRPNLRVLVMGGPRDESFVEAVILAGARGVLGYDTGETNLRMALEVVRDGSVWAPRRILSRLLDRATAAQTESMGGIHLTNREREVLTLLALGLSNREIAHALSIEVGSIKAHLTRLMGKAGVSSRTALGVHAIEAKWL
jgi:DNA-binding NarL/FixJ family response regulator